MTSNCVLTVTCVRSNHNPMNIIVTFAFHSTTVTLVPPHNTKNYKYLQNFMDTVASVPLLQI